MTDEMKKNLENEELELDALENVSGGLIVDCGYMREYRVVDDKTGEILDSISICRPTAEMLALNLNVSRESINMKEYKERFGKDIDLSIWIDSRTGRKEIKR